MANDRLIGVYGVGGFGREVIPFVCEIALARGLDREQVVFIDDGATQTEWCGHSILTLDRFCETNTGEHQAVIAVGDGGLRRRLADRCLNAGVGLPPIIAANAVLLYDVDHGEGLVMCPFSMISSSIQAGRLLQLNIYSYIAHDCVVGDNVTLAPGAKVNGNVHLGDDVYVGTGAIIKHGTPDRPVKIGAGATIGMGAVVTKDVPAGATVIGNPARPLD